MERVIYDRMRELEGSHWWFTGRRKVLTALIGDLDLPANARIAEVGCGVGGNLEMLRAFGAVEAVEPDGESRAYIGQRLGITVQDGLLPDGLPLAKESFDAVCAFDVVEHVDDDAGSVSALSGLVKTGGYLVITVPAYQWMWSHHDVLHHHKRRYRREAIEALVRGTGLQIVRSSYFNGLLFPMAAAVRLAKKALRIETEDDRMPPKTVNDLLASVFASEAGWLRRGNRLPFGLSIVVIGKKA